MHIRLFHPWGVASLATFTVTTTLLSICGFVARWGLTL